MLLTLRYRYQNIGSLTKLLYYEITNKHHTHTDTLSHAYAHLSRTIRPFCPPLFLNTSAWFFYTILTTKWILRLIIYVNAYNCLNNGNIKSKKKTIPVRPAFLGGKWQQQSKNSNSSGSSGSSNSIMHSYHLPISVLRCFAQPKTVRQIKPPQHFLAVHVRLMGKYEGIDAWL